MKLANKWTLVGAVGVICCALVIASGFVDATAWPPKKPSKAPPARQSFGDEQWKG